MNALSNNPVLQGMNSGLRNLALAQGIANQRERNNALTQSQHLNAMDAQQEHQQRQKELVKRKYDFIVNGAGQLSGLPPQEQAQGYQFFSQQYQQLFNEQAPPMEILGQAAKFAPRESQYEGLSQDYETFLRANQLQNSPEAYRQFQSIKDSRAAKSAVKVDARQMGTIPPGYRAEYDGQGRVTQLTPIPGGPAEREIQADRESKEVGSQRRLEAAQTVYEDVDRGLAFVDEYGQAAAGVGGVLTGWVPTLPADRLQKQIESIQGNIGIDTLLKIKREGSGLGQVPQAQLEMLASVLGKLSNKMHPEDLRYNLKRIQEIYADIVEKEGGDPRKLYEERKERLGGQKRQPKVKQQAGDKEVTRTGTLNGRKVIQYSDGSVEYAD